MPLLEKVVLLLSTLALTGDAKEVIVVGAGMGGISAALKLQQNGYSVTLLEGRDRVGGRTWTSTQLGFPTDLGASWVHGASGRNPLTAVVTELGLPVADHADEQRCRYDKDGLKYNARELTQFESWCWGPESSMGQSASATLEAALRAYDPAFFGTVEGEMCLAGWDFNQGSTIDLVNPAHEAYSEIIETGGPEWVLLEGYKGVVDGLLSKFQTAGGQVITDVKVTNVQYCSGFSSENCTVTVTSTDNGTAGVTRTAQAAVVAVPLGVLQKGSITFDPVLPTTHSAAISRMQFGVVNKAVAVFDTDFWSAGCNNELMVAINQQGANIDNRGMFPYFMNVNKLWPGKNALMGFAVGRYAIASEQKTDAQVQADFMTRLRQQYPTAPDPVQFIRSTWGGDEFAYGSYTTPSGINAQANELRALEKAVSASLTLAGEHTSPTFAATVHGAYSSGQRAADDIIQGEPTASAWAAGGCSVSLLLMAAINFW